MKFIVDESAGAAVAAYLRNGGYDIVVVGDDMPQALDADILARAASEGRVVLTNDKDFGELAFRSGQAHRGIVLFRLRDESAEARVGVLRLLLAHHPDQLENHFVVVTETGVRIRPA